MDRFIRIGEVIARTGLSRSTIYRRIADGTFPEPIKAGPRASRWLESEIDAWMQEQITKSRGETE